MIEARRPTCRGSPGRTGLPALLEHEAADLPSSSFGPDHETSAIGLLVIHILLPDRLKPPSTLRGAGDHAAGSEPWFGSVRPKQPIHSPVASLGRYFCLVLLVAELVDRHHHQRDCTLIIER